MGTKIEIPPGAMSDELRRGLQRAAEEGRLSVSPSVNFTQDQVAKILPVVPASVAKEISQAPKISAEVIKPVRGGGIDRRRPPEQILELSSSAFLSITVRGLKLRSEANAGGRLGNKIGRKDRVKEATWQALERLGKALFPLPVDVRLIRHGRHKLDSHDNLPMAFKSVADVVADWLGIKDNDSRVRWSYDQVAEWFDGMTIEIRERTPGT